MKTQKTRTQKLLTPVKLLGWMYGSLNDSLLRVVPNKSGPYNASWTDFLLALVGGVAFGLAVYGAVKLAGVL